MNCPYCGAKNGKSAVYCTSCYRKLDKPQKEKEDRPVREAATKPVRYKEPKPIKEKPVKKEKPVREKPVVQDSRGQKKQNTEYAVAAPVEDRTPDFPDSDSSKEKPRKKKRNPNKILDADYDGYYDDVLPDDYMSDNVKEGINSETMKKIGIIVGAAAVVIIIAVLIMIL